MLHMRVNPNSRLARKAAAWTTSGRLNSVTTQCDGTLPKAWQAALIANLARTTNGWLNWSCTSQAPGAAVYSVALRTWQAANEFGSERWARSFSLLDLRSSSSASLSLALGEHQGRGQIPEQRPLMRGTTSKYAAFTTVTHGSDPRRSLVYSEAGWTEKRTGPTASRNH